MASGLPPLNMDVNAKGKAVVLVDGQEVQEVSGLLDLAPDISKPQFARAFARLVNHLAHGYEYNVIMDPDAFEAAYRTKYNAEDPEEKTLAGQVRLRNYSLPDFSAISPPESTDGSLTFFAQHAYLGVPYRVVFADPTAKPVYSLAQSAAA